MHIELTEMLRCPKPHADAFLVLSTGEMSGRMVRTGILGCPVCHSEYPVLKGVADFSANAPRDAVPATPHPDAAMLQAFLDLSGPGGFVVLLGAAAREAAALVALMGGVHFIGVNAPDDVAEQPTLSLVRATKVIPLRQAMARAVVIPSGMATHAWITEAHRVLLPGRRLVLQDESASPAGFARLAAGRGWFVGEKR